jgi:hypothetical protein
MKKKQKPLTSYQIFLLLMKDLDNAAKRLRREERQGKKIKRVDGWYVG